MSKNLIKIVTHSIGDIIKCLSAIQKYIKLTNKETIVKLTYLFEI